MSKARFLSAITPRPRFREDKDAEAPAQSEDEAPRLRVVTSLDFRALDAKHRLTKDDEA
ncbi:MAG: hypothetical protein AAF618_13385 [Pseudomonadota bacterium]